MGASHMAQLSDRSGPASSAFSSELLQREPMAQPAGAARPAPGKVTRTEVAAGWAMRRPDGPVAPGKRTRFEAELARWERRNEPR